ncbi:MAG TPA: hypothetical protein VFZ18_09675 [Longimicrobiaceae bacterium]
MPSDPLMESAIAAAAPRCESFRAALAAAVAQVEGFLEASRAPAAVPAERAAHELGSFGASHVDGERFAALFADGGGLDAGSLERLERARDLLARLLARGAGQCVTRVPPGGDLRASVGDALAEIGRAFASARAVDLALSGKPAGEFGNHLAPFPYRRWNRAERAIAPVLVVEVEGGDLQAGGLAEYLDGDQKIVLVVHGATPAAPLVRLVTAGVTVAQTADPAELAAYLAAEGPAVVALMPAGTAAFAHRAGSGAMWERLRLTGDPAGAPAAAIGTFSVFQQQQELELLRELSTAPVAAPAPREGDGAATAVAPPAAPAPDPAGQLAAWLLNESGLTPA